MPLDLSGKRVLVTGDSGFLDSFLFDKLLERGCLEVLVPKASEFDFIRRADIERLVVVFEPDVVIHLAGVPKDSRVDDEPGRYIYETTVAGIELMEQSRRFGVKEYVCVDMTSVRPGAAPASHSEDRKCSGIVHASFSAAKTMLTQLSAYHQQYGMNGVFVVPPALYGPRGKVELRSNRVISTIIRKCIEAVEQEQTVIALHEMDEEREYLYVEDAAEGILQVLEHHDGLGPVRLGPGFEVSTKELAEKIARLTGFEGGFVLGGPHSKSDPWRCLGVPDAGELFGFKAATGFDEGLVQAVSWHLSGAETNLPLNRAEPPYVESVEEIRDGEQIVAVIVRGSFNAPGVSFFSENNFSQQLGFIRQLAGHVIAPHVHNAVPRNVTYTQETLVVREGRIRVDLYGQDRVLLTTRVLTTGDAILLASGGHGFEMLDDTSLIEVKQGPYSGDQDKTRFEVPE